MKIFFLIILIVVLSYGCLEKIDIREFNIKNNAKYDFFCIISSTDAIRNSAMNFNEDMFNRYLLIEKDSSTKLFDRPRNWDTYISYYCYAQKLRLFIVSKDSVDKYGWKEVISTNIYNKVYKFNINDLNRINWKMTYSGK